METAPAQYPQGKVNCWGPLKFLKKNQHQQTCENQDNIQFYTPSEMVSIPVRISSVAPSHQQLEIPRRDGEKSPWDLIRHGSILLGGWNQNGRLRVHKKGAPYPNSWRLKSHSYSHVIAMMLHPGPTPLVFSAFLVTPAPKSPDLCLEFSTRRAATLGRLVGHDTTKRRKPIDTPLINLINLLSQVGWKWLPSGKLT
jgi:hypothetical protein